MKYKISALLVCVLLLTASVLPASADGTFTLAVSVPEGASVGKTVDVTVTIASLPKSVSAFECEFVFDTAVLEPLVTTNENGEMVSFMAVNKAGLEQICAYKGNGVYYLAFCAEFKDDKEVPITDTGDLVIKIPFKVKAEGNSQITIPAESVLAFDTELADIGTSGTECKFVTLPKQDEFTTSVECKEALNGTRTYLTLNLTNKLASDGIAAFEIALDYSASSLKAVIIGNESDQMDAFIVSAPTGWQQICVHESNGRYRIRLVAPNGGTNTADCLALGQSITLSVPFDVIGEAESAVTFDIPYAECTAFASDLSALTGESSSASLTVGKKPTLTAVQDGVTVDGGYITGVPELTAVSDIGKYLNGEIKVVSDGNEVTDTSLVCNGMTAELWYNGQKMDSATVIVKGDINGDGKITATDALQLKRAYLGSYTLTDIAARAARIISDTPAEPVNYLAVKRHIQGNFKIK